MSDTVTPAERQDPGAHDLGGWLTLDQAAERYGVPRERLVQAADEGKMAVRRVGSGHGESWLVQPDQVEHFLSEQDQPPG